MEVFPCISWTPTHERFSRESRLPYKRGEGSKLPSFFPPFVAEWKCTNSFQILAYSFQQRREKHKSRWYCYAWSFYESTTVHLLLQSSSTQLAHHFHKPIDVAAKDLNICATVLKKICRRHGLLRWPSRKVSYFFRFSKSCFFTTCILLQLKSLKKQVHTLEKQLVLAIAKEDDEKRASIKKKIQQAKLAVANTLLVRWAIAVNLCDVLRKSQANT